MFFVVVNLSKLKLNIVMSETSCMCVPCMNHPHHSEERQVTRRDAKAGKKTPPGTLYVCTTKALANLWQPRCICGLSLAFNQPFSYLICQGTAFFGALPGALLHRWFFENVVNPTFHMYCIVLLLYSNLFQTGGQYFEIDKWEMGIIWLALEKVAYKWELNIIVLGNTIQYNTIQQMYQRK